MKATLKGFSDELDSTEVNIPDSLIPTTKNNNTNQDDLIAFVQDPKIIEKAVEGSMEKRQAVIDKANENRDMKPYIHHSNLIENIDDPKEDTQSLKAWEWLIKQDAIVPSVILALHYKITKNQLKKGEAGEYRKVQVWVGNYTPPPAMIVSQLVYDWCMDVNYTELEKLPREAHVAFEKIHPFIDGNGRTGRMLMWLQEKKLGQIPTMIRFEDRQRYYEWFK